MRCRAGLLNECRVTTVEQMSIQGILQMARRSGVGRLLILAYENVGAESGPTPAAPDVPGSGIDLGEFSWQMEQLSANFEPIPLSRLMGHLGGKRPLAGPQISICLRTDALKDPLAVIAVMRRLKISPTLLFAFDSIREPSSSSTNDAELDWAAIRELTSVGADIAHQVRSGDGLAQLDAAQRRLHFGRLRSLAEQQTGVPVNALAYAMNDAGEADLSLIYDAAIAGFNLGVANVEGINRLRSISPMLLKRRTVTAHMTRADFASLLDEVASDR